MAMKKKPVLIVAFVVALACAGLLGYDFVARSFWQGQFPLEVQVVSNQKHPITRVSFCTVASHELEEKILKAVRLAELELGSVTNFDGQRFTVDVPWGGYDSGLGRELVYDQCKLLFLKFDFADGPSLYKTVQIPDGRRSRRVAVEIQ